MMKCGRCGALEQAGGEGRLYWYFPDAENHYVLCIACRRSFLKWLTWVNPDEPATSRWFARSLRNGRKKHARIMAGGDLSE